MDELLDYGLDNDRINYIPATLGQRFIAFCIDLVSFSCFVVLALIGTSISAIIFLIALFFLGAYIKNPKRQSLGEILLRIRVVHIESPYVHWGNTLVRLILKLFLIFNPLITLLITVLVKSRKKDTQQIFLHDIASNTKVVQMPL